MSASRLSACSLISLTRADLFCFQSGCSLASSFSASITFSSAVYWGKRLKDWNTRPKCSRLRRMLRCRSAAGTEVSSSVSPLTLMTPASGVSRKLRQRSRVVLPLPEEPIRDRTDPFSMEKEISSSTRVEPKDLRMFCTSRIAMGPYLLSQRKYPSFFSMRPNTSVRMPVKTR